PASHQRSPAATTRPVGGRIPARPRRRRATMGRHDGPAAARRHDAGETRHAVTDSPSAAGDAAPHASSSGSATTGRAAAASDKPVVWFPDTSALIPLAVHQPLHDAVITLLSAQRRVLLQVVIDELAALTGGSPPTARWAAIALRQLAWLGTPVRVDDPEGT